MFSRIRTVSSAWVHLLTADLLVAISIYRECISKSPLRAQAANKLSSNTNNKMNSNDNSMVAIPHRHSVMLCLLFGPLGYLSHVITKSYCIKMKIRNDNDINNAKITLNGIGPTNEGDNDLSSSHIDDIATLEIQTSSDISPPAPPSTTSTADGQQDLLLVK